MRLLMTKLTGRERLAVGLSVPLFAYWAEWKYGDAVDGFFYLQPWRSIAQPSGSWLCEQDLQMPKRRRDKR